MQYECCRMPGCFASLCFDWARGASTRRTAHDQFDTEVKRHLYSIGIWLYELFINYAWDTFETLLYNWRPSWALRSPVAPASATRRRPAHAGYLGMDFFMACMPFMAFINLCLALLACLHALPALLALHAVLALLALHPCIHTYAGMATCNQANNLAKKARSSKQSRKQKCKQWCKQTCKCKTK